MWRQTYAKYVKVPSAGVGTRHPRWLVKTQRKSIVTLPVPVMETTAAVVQDMYQFTMVSLAVVWLSEHTDLVTDPTKYVSGTDPALYGPKTVQNVGSYTSQGCYSEGTNGRALSALQPKTPVGGFTIESCAAACGAYQIFGMEFANQCYCGNSIGAGSVNQTSSNPAINGCNMVCAGNVNEYCGGKCQNPTKPFYSNISNRSQQAEFIRL